MTELLCLIIGLLLGFYGDRIHQYVKNTYEAVKDAREYKAAGVVRPGVTPVKSGSNQPIDLSVSTGGVRRPSPEMAAVQQLKEREERLKRL